jgi:autotransporter-associated beta strand protein
MTGKFVLRSFVVVAIVLQFVGLGSKSAFAANYYFDNNGATAGDGVVNNSIYAWSTNTANWSTSSAGTVATAAWVITNTAYFGGMAGDTAGWNYTMSADATVTKFGGGINVGSVAPGTVTFVNNGNPNFYLNNNLSWTVAAGSTLIDNVVAGNGAVNLNNKILTLTGAGNVTIGGGGLDHATSGVLDNLTGIMTINAAAKGSFDTTSTFSWNSGSLALGDPFALGSAQFIIGSSASTNLNLSNINAGAMTLTSVGPITVNSSFSFTGSNSLSFGSGLVTLNTTPTINVAGNTLTFQSAIGGASFGINKTGTGTLALTAANSYGGGTTISAGTLSLGTAGTPGSGSVTVQPGAALDASAYLGTLSIGGSLGVNSAVLAYGGPLNIGGNLNLNSGTLTSNPGNSIAVTGGLTLGGVNYVVPKAVLVAGTYPLFSNYTSLSGGTANLALSGFFASSPRQSFAFDASSGIAVNLVVTGNVGNLQWVGGTNSVWDTQISQNWYNTSSGSADFFNPVDNVTFNDTPGTATTVNISGTVLPGSVTVSNAAVNYTFSGTGSIGGAGPLQVNGPGTLTITNSNTFSGGTVLSGGLLNINNAKALGTGALTIGGGSIDNASGGPITLAGNSQNWTGSFVFLGSNLLNTGTGAVAVSNGPTVTVNAGTLNVGGAMSGNSALTKDGNGLLVLTAGNVFTGPTTISNGILQLGTGQSGMDGALNATSGMTNNAVLVFNVAGNQTAAYSIGGSGSLTKLGSGNVALSNANTFTGPTSVNAGILTLQNGGMLGTLQNSAITVGSGAELDLNANDALGFGNTSSLTVFGLVKKINAESETLFRPITLSGGTLTATAAAGAPNGSWDFFGTTIETVSGTTNYITGGSANIFSVRGNGSINLDANSTLTITVPIMQNSSVGSSPNLNIQGPGTMILAGTTYNGTGGTSAVAVQVGFGSIPGNLVLAGSSTFPGTSDGYFQIAYGSTVTVSNSATVFVQSDLKLGSNALGSSGSVVQNGGVLAVNGVDTVNGNRSLVIGEYDGETSNYNLSAGSLAVPNGWTYVGQNGTGIFNVSGGTATLAGINFSGAGASVLNLSGNGLLSIGGSGISNNNSNANAVLSGGTLAATAGWSTSLPMTFNGPATFSLQGNTVAFLGALSGSGGLTPIGPGTLVLGGSNTYSGGTTVPSGLVLRATSSNALGTGSVSVAGSLDVSQNQPATLTVSSLTFPNQATINLPVFSSSSSLTLQTGSLTANGPAGSVQFSFPPTTISAGTYRLIAYSGAIGGTGFGAFSVSSPPILGSRQSGTLQNNPNEIDYLVQGLTPYWNGQQQDWQSTNAWTLSPGGGLTTFQAGDNDVFDDTAGSGAFGTSVALNHGNVNPISVTFNNASSAYTISGSNGITGTGLVLINGGGSVTIATSNAYSGGTQFNVGTLNINNPAAIGIGMLTIAGTGGNTLGNTSGGPITISTNNAQQWNADFTFNGPYNLNLGTGAVTLGGSRTVTLAAGNLTVGGPIAGVGASLTLAGTGGLVLGGANTYNAGTLILGGSLSASDNNLPLGNGPVTISPASGVSTLSLTGTGPTINSLTNGGAGASNVVLGNAAGSSATTLNLHYSASADFSGAISDLSQTNPAAVGSLVVATPSILTLSGTNTYTGSTTVNSGTLQLGSPTALYAGSATGNAIVNGKLDLNGNSANVAGLSGTGSVISSVANASTLTVGYNNATSTFTGTVAASVLNLTKTGAGVLTMTSTDAAGTTAVSGGTVLFQGIVPGSTALSIAAGATLQYSNTDTVNLIRQLTTTLTGSGVLRKVGAGQLVFGNNTTTPITWSLGAGALIDVQQGSVIGGNGHADNWTNDMAALNVASGAIFDGVEANVNVDALTGGGTIASGWNGAYVGLTFGVNNGSGTFSGVLADHVHSPLFPGVFNKSGSGIQVLTGVSTYTGSTTITGGTLQLGTGVIGQDGSIATTSSVVDNAALVYDLAGSQTASYAISGSGSLSMIGGGQLILTGTANTYTGGTFVTGPGSLTVTSPSGIEDGTNLYIGSSVGMLGFPAPVVPASAVSASAVAPVPEPGTLVLVAIGFGTAAVYRRLRRRHSAR